MWQRKVESNEGKYQNTEKEAEMWQRRVESNVTTISVAIHAYSGVFDVVIVAIFVH